MPGPCRLGRRKWRRHCMLVHNAVWIILSVHPESFALRLFSPLQRKHNRGIPLSRGYCLVSEPFLQMQWLRDTFPFVHTPILKSCMKTNSSDLFRSSCELAQGL